MRRYCEEFGVRVMCRLLLPAVETGKHPVTGISNTRQRLDGCVRTLRTVIHSEAQANVRRQAVARRFRNQTAQTEKGGCLVSLSDLNEVAQRRIDFLSRAQTIYGIEDAKNVEYQCPRILHIDWTLNNWPSFFCTSGSPKPAPRAFKDVWLKI